MSIGAGLAIVGAWGCVAVAMISPRVTGKGFTLTLIAAVLATCVIAVNAGGPKP